MENNNRDISAKLNEFDKDISSKLDEFDKDISNKLDEFEQQPNEYTDIENESKRNKIIIAITICIILVLLLGIFVAMIPSKKDDNKVTLTKTTEENLEAKNDEEMEKKSGKKLDEDRAWVYDANYADGKKIKKVGSDSYTVNTKDNIKVPYININSTDAEKANSEIQSLYEKAYSEFDDGEVGNICEVKYNYYENDKMLSIVIDYINAFVPGGAGRQEMYIYNFNLETLKTVTLGEMAEFCGFSSGNDVIEKVRKWETKQIEILQAIKDKPVASFDGAESGKYFIGNDKKFNFIYRVNAAGSFLKTMPIELEGDIENIFEMPKEEKKSYFEENSSLQFSSVLNDDNNGKVALLRLGENALKTEESDGYYIYKDAITNDISYNIKEIRDIKPFYIDTSITNDMALFKCTIDYIDNNNASNSFDVAVLVASDFSNQELPGTFDSFSASTRCNKMFGRYSFLYKGEKDFQARSGEYATSVKNEYEVYYTIKTKEIDGIMVTSTAEGKTVVVHIDNIAINSSDVAAGTEYIKFSFKGYEEGTYKSHTGTGILSVSSDGNTYGLNVDLTFDNSIMEVNNIEIPGSTEGYINLINQVD